MQRQQLKKKSEIVLSPGTKASEIPLARDKSPFNSNKKEEINFETQKGFKVITKTEEKIGSRPAFRLNTTKIVDPKLTLKMKNLKIESNDCDSENNVKKAEDNLDPKSKIQLDFSTKKTVNDSKNLKPRDVI